MGATYDMQGRRCCDACDAAGTPLVPWSGPDRPTGSKEARAALVLPPPPAPVPALPAQLSLFGA